MPTWSDRYLRHFTYFFGKPFDIEVYRKDEVTSLRIATFDHGYKNYRIYASLGLSDQAELKDIGEVILLADDKGKDLPFLFVNALFFILEKRIPLGSRFAIGGIEVLNPDFAEYYQKQAIYFTLADGFAEGFEQVKHHGDIGLVFQGLFISWAEHDFLNRHGGAELEEKIKAQESDTFSLRRPSCVG